ncbi:hypothetical protein BD626DRAFT_512001 [Schizophyllum amplum]|uniref:Uncharacterized protein n=1 Tax=Schizophyllum amplum TaxID=97359 RepID=A0A550C0D8_9AGAR|nr:hypothetical protein BD626DRAFT_512001 [Auriculariopsis ampla]
MSTALSDEQCMAIFAQAKPIPQRPLPGQRLDLYPVTRPLDRPPPLRTAVVLDTLPPTYLLGWQYNCFEFMNAHEDIGFLEDHVSAFRESISKPLGAKFPHLIWIRPHYELDITNKTYTVYVATNFSRRSSAGAQQRDLIDGIMDLLGEEREPLWYRHLV